MSYTLTGFASLVQQDVRSPSVRRSPSPARCRCRTVSETVRVERRHAGRRDHAHVVGQHAQPDHGGIDADSRSQVRGSADAHAGRQRRAGARWRRNHLCRSARCVQQHQPGRRRLQQRVLRRAGGRTARRHRHHARSGQGIPGHRQRCARGVRPDRRWRGECDHQVRHERRRTAACFTSSGSRR